MREEDIGKVFLFALPWDWTVVGVFRGYCGGLMLLDDAGYFTRTGATFDRLCQDGFVTNGDGRTRFHFCGAMRVCASPNVVLPWRAAWPQPGAKRSDR